MLYLSWIEIPVSDMPRALAFYRAVFGLSDTPLYDEFDMQIAVLLPSEKETGRPGVSLVRSPTHRPADAGPQVNFHVGTHRAMLRALEQVRAWGGVVDSEIVDMGDGVCFIYLLDSEGNRIALSSYEPLPHG